MGSVPDDEKSSCISHTTTEARDISNTVLNIIFDYALNKFDDYIEQFAAGRPKFLSVIDKFVITESQIEMCLPAFPFKSANKVEKVIGILPDKAEELALERLNGMCKRIESIYPPGAKLTIISDGLVYNGSSSQPSKLGLFANAVYPHRQIYWAYQTAIPGLTERLYATWLPRRDSTILDSRGSKI